MQNRKTLNNLYHSIYDSEIKMNGEIEEALYHHGVLGMSWGERHGPPYPLTGMDKKIARAEAKRKREKERRLAKARKVAAQKRKEQKKQEEKQEKILKKKAKIIKDADLEKLRKNAKLFTNEEMQYTLERHDALQATKRPSKKDINVDEKLDKVVERLGKFAIIGTKVTDILKPVVAAQQMVNGHKESKIKDLSIDEKNISNAVKKIDQLYKMDPDQGKKLFDKEFGTNFFPDSTGTNKSNTDNKPDIKADKNDSGSSGRVNDKGPKSSYSVPQNLSWSTITVNRSNNSPYQLATIDSGKSFINESAATKKSYKLAGRTSWSTSTGKSFVDSGQSDTYQKILQNTQKTPNIDTLTWKYIGTTKASTPMSSIRTTGPSSRDIANARKLVESPGFLDAVNKQYISSDYRPYTESELDALGIKKM